MWPNYTASGRKNKWLILVLSALFVTSLLLKLPGIFNELNPFLFCDEGMWVYSVVNSLSSGSLIPSEFKSGTINIYPVLLAVKVFEFGFTQELDVNQITILARVLMNLILSSCSIFFIYGLGKRLGRSILVGVISAAFYAFSPFALAVSQYWYPDAYIAFFVSGFFYFLTVSYFEKLTPAKVLFQGLFLGLAISTKYTALVLAPFLILFYCYLIFSKKITKRAFTSSLGLSSLTAIVVYGILNFGIVLDFESFIQAWDYNRTNYSVSSSPQIGIVYYIGVAFFLFFPPLEVALVILGYTTLWSTSKFWFVNLLLLPAAYLGYLGVSQTFFNRNMSLLLPLLCVVGGIGTITLMKLTSQIPKLGKSLGWGLIFLVLMGPLLISINMAIKDTLPETRIQASEWVRSHIPSSRSIGNNQTCTRDIIPSVAGLTSMQSDRLENLQLDYYVIDSYYPSSFSEAFVKRGLIENFDMKSHHYLNSSGGNTSIFGNNSGTPNIDELAEKRGYKVVKRFSGSGPDIFILKHK